MSTPVGRVIGVSGVVIGVVALLAYWGWLLFCWRSGRGAAHAERAIRPAAVAIGIAVLTSVVWQGKLAILEGIAFLVMALLIRPSEARREDERLR